MAFIDEIYRQSIQLLPAPASYAANVVGQAYREVYHEYFPWATDPEHYKNFWAGERIDEFGRRVPFVEEGQRAEALGKVRNRPLPAHFSRIQERYSVGNIPGAPEPMQDMLMRGEQEFKGAKTVGQLEHLLVKDVTRAAALTGPQRFKLTIGESIGAAVEATYKYALPQFRGGEGNLRSFMAFATGMVHRGINTLRREGQRGDVPLSELDQATFSKLERDPHSNPSDAFSTVFEDVLGPEEATKELHKKIFNRAPYTVPTGITTDLGRQLNLTSQEIKFLTGAATQEDIRRNPLLRVLLPDQIPMAGDPYYNERKAATRALGVLEIIATQGPWASQPTEPEIWQGIEQANTIPRQVSTGMKDPYGYEIFRTIMEPESVVRERRMRSQAFMNYYMDIPSAVKNAGYMPGSNALMEVMQTGQGLGYRYIGERGRKLLGQTFPSSGPYEEPYYTFQRTGDAWQLSAGRGRVTQLGMLGQPNVDLGITSFNLPALQRSMGYTSVVPIQPGREEDLFLANKPPGTTRGYGYSEQQAASMRAYELRMAQQLGYFDPGMGAMVATTHQQSAPYTQVISEFDQEYHVARQIYGRGMEVIYGTHPAAGSVGPPPPPTWGDTAPPASTPTAKNLEYLTGLLGPEHPLTQAYQTALNIDIQKNRGIAFQPRQLVPTALRPYGPGNLRGHMTEEMAFRESPEARGTARDYQGHIRLANTAGEQFAYISQEALEQQYSGIERLQKSYMVEKAAGLHELGHTIWKRLGDEARNKFIDIYNATLENVGKKGMLAAEFDRAGRFNVREEFAQAYAAAALYSGEVLEHELPAYADFLKKYEGAITIAEEEVVLITHMGEDKAYVPRILSDTEIGQIPGGAGTISDYDNLRGYLRRQGWKYDRGNPQSRQAMVDLRSKVEEGIATGTIEFTESRNMGAGAQQTAYTTATRMLGYNTTYFQRGLGQGVWTANVFDPSQQAPPNATQPIGATPAPRNTPTPSAHTPFDAEMERLKINKEARELTPARLRRLTEANAPFDTRVSRGGGMILDKVNQSIILDPEQTAAAVSTGVTAVQTATSEQLPSGLTPRETVANVFRKINGAIEKTYDNAIRQAQGPAEERALRVQKKLATNVARSLVGRATGMSSMDLGLAQGAAYAQEVVTPENVDAKIASDSILQAREAAGMDLRALAGGGGRGTIITGEGGYPYRFGGPPGGPSARAPRRLSLWSGRMGGAMYAAYIAKRMWGMTAGPEFGAAAQYGAGLGDIAGMQNLMMAQQYGVGGMTPLVQTDVGFGVRQQMLNETMGRGAYQQWGGITDAMYSLSGGGGGFPRAMSGLKVAAGIGIGGSIIGQTLGFMGAIAPEAAATIPGLTTMAGIGTGIATIAPYLAAGAGLGILGMEAYNQIFQPETPLTAGGMVRSATNWWNYSTTSNKLAIGQGLGMLGLPEDTPARQLAGRAIRTIMSPLMNIASLSGFNIPTGQPSEQVLAQMTPEARAMYEYSGMPAQSQRLLDQLKAVNQATYADIGEMQGSLRALTKGIGYVPTDMAASTVAWSGIGLTPAEGFQSMVNLASQMGRTSGSEGYMSLWRQFNAIAGSGDIAQYEALVSRGQRVAQFGQQIAPYAQTTAAALRLTDQYDLTNAIRMAPVQSLIQTGAEAGLPLDEIIAYELQGEYESARMVPRTFGQAAAEQADRRKTFITRNIDQPVMSALQGAGIPSMVALTGAQQFGFTTPLQAQQFSQWVQTGNQFGVGYGLQAIDYGNLIGRMQPYQASLVPQIATTLMQRGYTNAMEAVGSGMANMTPAQATTFTRAMGGDLMTMAWTAATDPGMLNNPAQWKLYNQARQPIYQTDFGAFMRLGAAWEGQMAQAGLVQPGTFAAANMNYLSASEQAASFFGSNDMEAMQAWATGGAQGRTALHRSRMAGFQRASAGVAMASVNLSRQYLWGGGQWTGTPAEGSIWWYQDQLRALGNRQQLSNFAYSQQMMDTQNQFAIRGENIQFSRMQLGQDFQRWQMGFQFQSMMQQRGWARQDWQFQDQMRGLSYEWSLEDVNEAIRTSTGRRRAQLVRQRERLTTRFNLEGEQIDTQRDRQEETWAREDERFSKQRQYQEELMELDREQFDLQQEQRSTIYEMEKDHLQESVRFYKERYDLETELQAVQREFQAKQLDLQAQSAAIQAAAAEEQIEYNKQMGEATKLWETTEGYIKEAVKQEPEIIFKAFADMTTELDSTTKAKIDGMAEVYKSMNSVTVSTVDGLMNLFSAINNVSPYRVGLIMDIIAGLNP